MVTILMISAKLANPGLLKIKTFQNKGYNVLIHDHNVTKKISSSESNDIVDAVM